MPEVVFLPGFMQHADTWSPVAAGVGERYPSKVVEFATWTFDERLAEIGDATSTGDVLVGYSMGGRLALHAALRDPERYAGLVMLGASPGIADASERTARAAADEDLAAWIESQPITAVVERWERNPVFATQPPELVSAQRRGRLRHSPADLARLLRTAGQGALPPLWQRLAELRMPVLAVAGEHDSAYRAIAERMGAYADARDGPLRIESALVPGAGHAAHLEQPERVRDLLLDWIARSQSS